MQPVSVIATVLNEVDEIGRLVSSLMSQIPPPSEVVIVDGGSTDGTWERLLDEARVHPNLVPIRDESCNLKRCPGPISRGRNVAIAAASSQIVACADAGCTYAPDWLARLTAPIAAGAAEYALGGACLDPVDPTVWDLASAHFFGVKLSPSAPTKSCTARSMAFTKQLWQRIGGFPESFFYGEDTLFDLEARRVTRPAFVERAKALYRPQYTFRSACRQLASYASSDGVLGVRAARLYRNAARCLVQLIALLSPLWALAFAHRYRSAEWWSLLPLAAVLAIEAWFAFHPDWRMLLRYCPRALLARFLFSILVPWIVAVNRLRGALGAKFPPNRQNA
jgi:glycosyltransferase involved in cell wall biosynthesis